MVEVSRLLTRRDVKSREDPTLRPSAVLLLCYKKDGTYCVLFNKRTEKVEFNKGDICFPGGSKDPGDADLITTALRETREEMGVEPTDVTILGELDSTTTNSGFSIKPYVGTIPSPYNFTPSKDEVAEVLEIPFSSLLSEAILRVDTRVLPDGQVDQGRAYVYGPHYIYGATARILTQFLYTVRGSL
jgi:8-oxo-dGTP pyrophosphatase MutT (NUDIX family)